MTDSPTSNQCDVCGAPATQWVGDPWGKSNVTRPKCAEHGVRLRDPAGIAEIERLRAALADVAKRLKTGYEPGCDCGGCRTMRYAEKALIGVAVETSAQRCALPVITIQMLADFGQEGFFEKTTEPVLGIAGVSWSQAAVDFACLIQGLPAEKAGETSAGRTPQDYAIEHAGYLADAVGQFLEVLNECDCAGIALSELDEDDEEYDDARQDVEVAWEKRQDHLQAVQNAVYEFRKRAERAKGSAVKAGEST